MGQIGTDTLFTFLWLENFSMACTLFKIYFIFNYVYPRVGMCMRVRVPAEDRGVQFSGTELELQAVVST